MGLGDGETNTEPTLLKPGANQQNGGASTNRGSDSGAGKTDDKQVQPGSSPKDAADLSRQAQGHFNENGGQGNKTFGSPKVDQAPFQDNKGNSLKVLAEGDKAYVADGKGNYQQFQATRSDDGKIQTLSRTNEQGQQEVIYAKHYKPSNVPDGQKQTKSESDNKQGTASDTSKPQSAATSDTVGTDKAKSILDRTNSGSSEGKQLGADSERAERLRQAQEAQGSSQPRNSAQTEQAEPSRFKSSDQVMNRQSIMAGDQAKSLEGSNKSLRSDLQGDSASGHTSEKALNRQSLNEVLGNHPGPSAESIKLANGPVQNGLTADCKTIPAKDSGMDFDRKEGVEQSKAQWADRKEVIEQTSSGKGSIDRSDVIEQTSSGKVSTDRLDVNEQSSIGKANFGDGKGGIIVPAKAGAGAGGPGTPEGAIGKAPVSKPGEPGKGGGGGGVGGGGSRGDRGEGSRGDRDGGKSERGEKGEPGKAGRNDREPGKSDSGKSEGGKSDRGDKKGDGAKDEKGNRGDKQDPSSKGGRTDGEPGKGVRDNKDPGKGDRGGRVEPGGKGGAADSKPDKGDRVAEGKSRGPEKRFPLDPVLTAKIQTLSALPSETRRHMADVVGKIGDKQDLSSANLRNSKEAKVLNQLQELNLPKETLASLRKYISEPKAFPFDFTKFDDKTQKKFAEILKELIVLGKDETRSRSAEKPALKDASVQKSVTDNSTKPLVQPRESDTRTVIQKGSESSARINSSENVARQSDTVTKPADFAAKQLDTVTKPVVSRDEQRSPQEQRVANDQRTVFEQRAVAPPPTDKHDKTQILHETNEDEQSDTKVSAQFEEIFSEVFSRAVPKPESSDDEDSDESETEKAKIEKEEIEAKIAAERDKKNNRKTRQHYEVKEGDTVNSIAKDFLQDEAFAVVIYHHNKGAGTGKGKQGKFEIPLREFDGKTCAVPRIGSRLMIPTPARAKDFFKLPGAGKYYAHIDFGVLAEPDPA